MLQAIRNKMHGWPSVILLGICVLAMSLFGMESYFTSRNDTFVAKVGKHEITQNDFQTRMNQRRQQLSEQEGDQFDSSAFERPEVKQQILDAMVDQQLLLQANDDWGMRVSDQAVRDYIATIPAFQLNNQFDPTTYRTYLESQRQTPDSFENEIRSSLATQLIPDAVNDYLAPNTWTRTAVAASLRPGQTLLLGGYHLTGPADQPKAYNSLLALRSEGGDLALDGIYDKFRLVPFGEYLPAEGLLGPLGFKKLVHVTDGFDAGPTPRPIAPAGLPRVQPLICYESLFPGFVREGARQGGRPAWIVNISNDAWFGKTSGPLQHLNIASYRAIEEGLPMVRATPTGVSAVIDAYGRVRPGAQLGQGAQGVIDAPLPPALAPTPFSRWGETIFWSLMTLSASIGCYAVWRGSVTPRVSSQAATLSEG